MQQMQQMQPHIAEHGGGRGQGGGRGRGRNRGGRGGMNNNSDYFRGHGGRGNRERYFIIKSKNQDNIDISVRDGIWATIQRNEEKLNRAFRECARVILIFSVNNSKHFQGYATMTSAIDPSQTTVWLQHDGKTAFKGSMFHVRWDVRHDLPFTLTVNITNPWNENLPIKRSRDGQELPMEVGARICQLFAEYQQHGPATPTPGPMFNQNQTHLSNTNLHMSNQDPNQMGQYGYNQMMGQQHPNQFPPMGQPFPQHDMYHNDRPRRRPIKPPPNNSTNPLVNISPAISSSVKYFVIKSSCRDHVDISIRDGIWATTKKNEDKLNNAFHQAEAEGGNVYLIFSVNRSGSFCGYARMSSLIDPTQSTVWLQEGGKTSFTGNMFHVQWIRTSEVNFRTTLNLPNPLNNNLPVKRSFDGQELPHALGEQLCKMFDDSANGFEHKMDGAVNNQQGQPLIMQQQGQQLNLQQAGMQGFNDGVYADAVAMQHHQQQQFQQVQQPDPTINSLQQGTSLATPLNNITHLNALNPLNNPLPNPLSNTLMIGNLNNVSLQNMQNMHNIFHSPYPVNPNIAAPQQETVVVSVGAQQSNNSAEGDALTDAGAGSDSTGVGSSGGSGDLTQAPSESAASIVEATPEAPASATSSTAPTAAVEDSLPASE
mmetsp:Transcript_10769/g.20449  ORF Transcript_10769/g.20449 Transcript_10769/m.20449 type:complete len:654 (+) Transcript_10769:2-1963(+)